MKKEWLTDTPIAHRGITDKKEKITENTIEAIKLCLKYNMPTEVDVRITKENKIILLHDDYIVFNDNSKKHYRNITLKDINNKLIKNSNCKISLLEDVLNIINGEIPILIEPKIMTKNKEMKDFINKLEELLNNYEGPIAIHSFHFNIGKLYKNKNIKRGIILPLLEHYPNFIKNFINKLIIKNKPYDFISFNVNDINKKTIKYLKKINKPILLWTIDINKYHQNIKDIEANYIVKIDKKDIDYL